jgi:hypothetical protein
MARTRSDAASDGDGEASLRAPDKRRGWLFDLNMLAITGGRERTAHQFSTLLDRAGCGVERITTTESPLSVILAAASGREARA